MSGSDSTLKRRAEEGETVVIDRPCRLVFVRIRKGRAEFILTETIDEPPETPHNSKKTER